MEKNFESIPTQGSPFFELLAEAEEIKIREILPETQEKLQGQVARHMSELGADAEATHRTFFIRVKTKPPPPKKTQGPEDRPAENRLYLLKSAELLVEEADYLLARNIYSYLLKADVRDKDAMKGLGLCFIKLGDTTSARKCLRALLELDGDPETHFWLAQCAIIDGKDRAAVDQCRQIADPGVLKPAIQFEFLKEWANCETRLGNLDDAWSLYHKALALTPNSEVIYANLGSLEIQRQHPEVAQSYFAKALELNPKSSRGYAGMGLVAAAQNDIPAAIIAFETALDLDNQNLLALFQLVNISDKPEQLAGVRARLEAFLTISPKHLDARYALACLFYRESDWTACRRELDEILGTDRSHTRAKSLRDELDRNKHNP